MSPEPRRSSGNFGFPHCLLRSNRPGKCVAIGGIVCILVGVGIAAPPIESTLAPLRTGGNELRNDRNELVRLRGVNAAGLEFDSKGQGRILKTVAVAIHDWRVNVVRLPLSQDRWFGHAPDQQDGGKAYQELVAKIGDYCATNRCYLVLDLHWSNCGEWGKQIGQHSMPDRNSLVFWRDIAPRFANRPEIIFDLYNEPHDVSWEVWRHGGTITDTPNLPEQMKHPKTYEAVGMQTLLDAVRATGAKNLVIVGGLHWAYDFSGLLQDGPLQDPDGRGVLYANHCYDNKNESVATWRAQMVAAAARFPVIVSEFGGEDGPGVVPPEPNWLQHVLRTLEEQRWSWIAWDLHPHAGPELITDWNYTPTPKFGVHVKKVLADNP